MLSARVRRGVLVALVGVVAGLVFLTQHGVSQETPYQPWPGDSIPPILPPGQPWPLQLPGQQPDETPPEEMLAEVCAWWDSLGYPDVQDGPLVRFLTGSFREVFRDGYQFEVGYVLEETEDSLRILTLDAIEVTIPQHGVTRDGHEWSPEPIPFLEVARVVESQTRETFEDLQTPTLSPYLFEVPMRTVWHSGTQAALLRLLFIARQAAARGNEREALRAVAVWQQARRSPEVQRVWVYPEGSPERSGGQLTQTTRAWTYQDVLSEWFYQRAVYTLSNQQSAWTDVRQAFARCVANNGGDEAYRQAVDAVAMVEQMIAEEEAHDAAEVPPFAERSAQQMLAELVFELRNVRSDRMQRPLENPFGPPREDEAVLDQLIGLGLPAVPTLIDLLADRRFTRSVWWGRLGWSGPHPPPPDPLPVVLRYQTMAWYVLTSISGVFVNGPYDRQLLDDLSEERMQTTYRAWYDRVQEIGLAAVLEEQLRQGADNACVAAPRLAIVAPDRFFEVIGPALAAPRSRSNRFKLLRSLLQVDVEAVTELIFAEVEAGPLTQQFPALFSELHARLPERAQALLVQFWERLTRERDARTLGRDSEVQPLAEATLPLGEGPAMREMTARLWELQRQHREWLTDHVLDQEWQWRRHGPPASLRGSESLETFFITMLEREVVGRRSIGGRRVRGNWPDDSRLCDEVGAVLALLWPERYRFDHLANRYERDVQCVECLNAWREPRGLELLPVPEPPPPPIEPPENQPQSQPQSRPNR